ncbi:MlaD family protein [Roseofilum casamattae]|uniref:MlaD family protein n=1 Tax=Roseofilum casamattae BLCC-M143 TaxID=3022442 RepID=A0ABT7BX83_9CYAN|nr:MlaD family protein [Roseofilum casamattae]MDJ1183066.1 MlaD family protein [Roseofilum casamattae BLCC-M143]
MRQRTIREGSVGLLIAVGVGLFGGLVLWLRGATFGQKTYSAIVEFASVEGMQIGADVRYRGVDVGGITAINPSSNGVEVTITIVQPDLLMPKNATIEANQSGLVGATSIDIIPLAPLPGDITYNALSAECDRELLICNGSRLQGVVGVSYLELLREGLEVSRLLSSDEFYTQLLATLEGATAAAESFTSISGDLSELMAELSEVTILAKGEISTISNATQSVGSAADSIRQSTLQVTDQFTQNAATLTAQVETTSVELQKTLANLNGLMTANRSTLTNTLANLEQTSQDIQGAVSRLTPIIGEVEQSQLLGNLETLSNNAAQASANLRDISNGINNPNTLLMLQETLDSARSTFQNTQKLTSDIDDLLGDPEFRDNIRNLVDGLGDLFSSTEELETHTQIARVLAPIETELNSSVAGEFSWSEWQQNSLTETALDVESEPVEEPEQPLSVNFQLNSTSLFETKPQFQSQNFAPEIDFEN